MKHEGRGVIRMNDRTDMDVTQLLGGEYFVRILSNRGFRAMDDTTDGRQHD